MTPHEAADAVRAMRTDLERLPDMPETEDVVRALNRLLNALLFHALDLNFKRGT